MDLASFYTKWIIVSAHAERERERLKVGEIVGGREKVVHAPVISFLLVSIDCTTGTTAISPHPAPPPRLTCLYKMLSGGRRWRTSTLPRWNQNHVRHQRPQATMMDRKDQKRSTSHLAYCQQRVR